MIKDPDPEPEMTKQDLIKYISKKKAAAEAEVQPEDEQQLLWDVNPAMVENYWSTTNRD